MQNQLEKPPEAAIPPEAAMLESLLSENNQLAQQLREALAVKEQLQSQNCELQEAVKSAQLNTPEDRTTESAQRIAELECSVLQTLAELQAVQRQLCEAREDNKQAVELQQQAEWQLKSAQQEIQSTKAISCGVRELGGDAGASAR